MTTDTTMQVKNLIRETNTAYSIFAESSCGNTDYAEFASLALSEFKNVLRQPGLTHGQLSRMLRQGSYQHKICAPKSCWATFLAHYVSNVANGDGATRV